MTCRPPLASHAVLLHCIYTGQNGNTLRKASPLAEFLDVVATYHNYRDTPLGTRGLPIRSDSISEEIDHGHWFPAFARKGFGGCRKSPSDLLRRPHNPSSQT